MKPNNPTVIAFPAATVPGALSSKPQENPLGIVVPFPSTVASGILFAPLPQVAESAGVPIAQSGQSRNAMSATTGAFVIVPMYIYRDYHFRQPE